MKVVILGSGTSTGVPRVGNDWGACDPYEPRNRRTRVSVLVESAEGKRLLITIEQRGCIYCTKMHEEVFPDPAIDALIREHFFVVQINMFGDVEVTDFDGTVLPEKAMANRWGGMFTPTMMFLQTEVAEGKTAAE